MTEPLPDLPNPGAPCVDAHAHLAMLDDPAGALVHAAQAGLALVATVVDLSEEPETTFGNLDSWLTQAAAELEPEGLTVPEVRLIVGWHPQNASKGSPEMLAQLRELATDPRVGGFGELGLDYHYELSPREDQRAWFRSHLALAAEVGLPVEIHLREAHEEGIEILREVGLPPAGCVIHCFTEGPDLAERFLELGCYISFAGPVTFKNSNAMREAAALVPLDRLLVETDCPFLAPHPYRGRPNEPAMSVLNAVKIAEVKGLPVAEVSSAALANARALFERRDVR